MNGELARVSRQKPFSPVSASLPNHESAFFLDRLKAIRLAHEEELNRTLNEANDGEILEKRRRPFVPRVMFCGIKMLILKKSEILNHKTILAFSNVRRCHFRKTIQLKNVVNYPNRNWLLN